MVSRLPFQNEVSVKDNDDVCTLLAAKKLLQNEVHSLNKKNKALESSTAAFVEEILEDLQHATFANSLPVNYIFFYISWYHFCFIVVVFFISDIIMSIALIASSFFFVWAVVLHVNNLNYHCSIYQQLCNNFKLCMLGKRYNKWCFISNPLVVLN
nr:uncharacterized protein LOC104095664 [Nicotiana tomentosiformis]